MFGRTIRAGLLVATCLAAFGCSAAVPAVPIENGPPASPVLTLVWVGRGEAERLEGGKWRRVPEFDYDFSVEQRRFATHWESVKSMRRRHPAYDGSAGPRAQTMFFNIGFAEGEGSNVKVSIASSIGEGRGTTDREFREAVLEMTPDVSSFAPFDTYRITQHYGYEAGTLGETVELFKKAALGSPEKPWVRNREVASLFSTQKFEHAPTRFGENPTADGRSTTVSLRATSGARDEHPFGLRN